MERSYMLQLLDKRVPLVSYADSRVRPYSLFSILNVLTGLYYFSIALTSLLVLAGSISIDEELRKNLAIAWASCGVIVAMYLLAGTYFHVKLQGMAHRYKTETVSGMVVKSVMTSLFLAAMWTMTQKYGRMEHFDDDGWIDPDPKTQFDLLEGRDVEAVTLGVGVAMGILLVYVSMRELVAHVYPEQTMRAMRFVKRQAMNTDKSNVYRGMEESYLRKKSPTMSYFDSDIPFWSGFNMMNMSLAVFIVGMAVISLLVLTQTINMSERLRHGLGIGYATGGLLLAVGCIRTALHFYPRYTDTVHCYNAETRGGTIGKFAMLSVALALFLVVSNQYGKNGVIEDDDAIDDLHFDDDSYVDDDEDRQFLKEEGKDVEATVLAFMILVASYAIYTAVREAISHMYAEVTTNTNEFISRRHAMIFQSMATPRLHINPDSPIPIMRN